jgi:dihydrolipoamide dehydrogenase
MSGQYRIIVIGSGSAGKEAALLAARAGLHTLVVEADQLGGTGIHRGCHVVRALRACATHYGRIKETDRLGVYLDLITTNWSNWLNVQKCTTERLSVELSRALEQAHVEIKFGRAELFDPHTVVVHRSPNESETVTGEYLILATGSRPSFPGNERARIVNSDQLLQSSLVPKKLFVIGGGYIGCEIAAIYRSLGVEVILAEAESRLLPTWDEEIGQRMHKVLDEADVRVLLNERVELPPQDLTHPPSFKLGGLVISPDLTLVAVGRTANVAGLKLDRIGLPPERFISVNEQLRTEVPSVFAIGDVNGMVLLDSVGAAQARAAIQAILGHEVRFEPHWIPRCLHTNPPIATVGWTEKEALAAGLDFEVFSENLPLITDDDATIVEPENNQLKLVIQTGTDRILGCLAIGSGAVEIVNLLSTGIRAGFTARELANWPLIHPSASEAVVRVLQERFDRKLSAGTP